MFVKNKSKEVGDWVITTRNHKSLAGTMIVGTKVKIIGVGERGYDIEDEEGNKVIECGWEL